MKMLIEKLIENDEQASEQEKESSLMDSHNNLANSIAAEGGGKREKANFGLNKIIFYLRKNEKL